MTTKPALHFGLIGPPGSGKTALACSASTLAGPTFTPGSAIECPDVVLLEGDTGGSYGAIDAGFKPRVEDFSCLESLDEYEKRLKALKPAIIDAKVVIIDLAPLGRLVVDKVKPTSIPMWGLVAAEGLKLFSMLHRQLAGKLVIYCCQVKSVEAAVESEASKLAAEARAIGGDKSQFTWDLSKGVARPFIENCSLILARDVKKSKPAEKNSPATLIYTTYTAASKRFEVKTRFSSKLPPTLPGDATLRSIINKIGILDY